MPPKVLLQTTRKQLYDEIWEISVAGVAKKYDAKYPHLMKQIKAANIPVPPPGYWSKVSCGKTLAQEPLQEPVDEIIAILGTAPSVRKRIQSPTAAHSSFELVNVEEEEVESVAAGSMEAIAESDTGSGQEKKTFTDANEQAATPLEVDEFGEPETYESYGQVYNVYNRETLYKEVWKKP